MRINIYRYEQPVTRSVLRAIRIAEIESDELPDDVDRLAYEYGGDFIEIDNSEDE